MRPWQLTQLTPAVTVRRVIKIDEVGKAMNLHPRNRLAGRIALPDQLQARALVLHLGVAVHAGLGGRNRGVGRLVDRGVAIDSSPAPAGPHAACGCTAPAAPAGILCRSPSDRCSRCRRRRRPPRQGRPRRLATFKMMSDDFGKIAAISSVDLRPQSLGSDRSGGLQYFYHNRIRYATGVKILV